MLLAKTIPETDLLYCLGASCRKRSLYGPVVLVTLRRVACTSIWVCFSTNANWGKGDGGGGLMTFGCECNSKIPGVYSVFSLFDVRVSFSCCCKEALCADCWKATGAADLLQELDVVAHNR